ncbi:aldose 1-epimerase family protein [Corynebacterium epidermidicanis]|uniref:Galactose mutarotase-like enzyme n=1 Tax=Corynebacterium epidermidicanis TaxID=1050174 RepID=A0A0G3GRF5_9CORY|nr:aldose 1-epimerase family protein [Corynebacterium epidermidicanis]AKK03699.1 galactose mutarotase-like enzyme [Corynebacterium epidermidicanis]
MFGDSAHPGGDTERASKSANTSPVVPLALGDYRAEISTWGGGLKALTWRGAPLIETYPDGEFPPLSAGVVLAPWPNRVADGTFAFNGQRFRLPINEPERNNAIHGFVSDRQWQILKQLPAHTVLAVEIPETEFWPWPLTITATYQLGEDGLHATFTATGSAPQTPYAFGLHTYLNAQGAPLDECVLEVHVDKQLPLDDRNLPRGELTDPKLNLAQLPMRGVLLDDCFHATDGAVRLTSAGSGVEMHCSAGLDWLQIFTPDPTWGEPYPGRGRSVAVEPMSAPPNALVTGTCLDILRASEPLSHQVHIFAVSPSIK